MAIEHLVYCPSGGDIGQSRRRDSHDRYHDNLLRLVMLQIISFFFKDQNLIRCQPEVARVIPGEVLGIVEQQRDYDN